MPYDYVYPNNHFHVIVLKLYKKCHHTDPQDIPS